MASAAHWFGSQLARPEGRGGWLVGHLMRMLNRAPIRLAMDALAVGSADVVLDLGCGPGLSVTMLARKARHVHGVDASPTMLRMAAHANRKGIAAGVVTFAEGDFGAIPLPDRSVDKVLAVNVAYFWNDMDRILGEIRRVARPGAQLAIYVTAQETMRHWRFADTRTHRHFDASSLAQALCEGGVAEDRVSISTHRLAGGVRAIVALVEL